MSIKASSQAVSFRFLDASSMTQLSITNKKWNHEIPEIVKNLLPRIICEGPIRNADLIFNNESPYDFDRALQITNDLSRSPAVSTLSSFLSKNPYYDINSSGRLGWTVLAVAIDKQSLPLVKNILDRDRTLVNRGWGERRDKIPYIVTAAYRGTLEIVREFVNQKANVNGCSQVMQETPLYASSLEKQIDMTKYLLLRGAILYQKPRARDLRSNDLSEQDRRALKNQPLFIYQVIGQIQREHASLFSAYAKIFPRLPEDAVVSILDYSEHSSLRSKFIEPLK